MSKFLFNPRRHSWFRSATREEQEILEVNDLRENRQLLVQLFGIVWRPPVRRDKLKFPNVDGFTTLLHIRKSEAIKR